MRNAHSRSLRMFFLLVFISAGCACASSVETPEYTIKQIYVVLASAEPGDRISIRMKSYVEITIFFLEENSDMVVGTIEGFKQSFDPSKPYEYFDSKRIIKIPILDIQDMHNRHRETPGV